MAPVPTTAFLTSTILPMIAAPLWSLSGTVAKDPIPTCSRRSQASHEAWFASPGPHSGTPIHTRTIAARRPSRTTTRWMIRRRTSRSHPSPHRLFRAWTGRSRRKSRIASMKTSSIRGGTTRPCLLRHLPEEADDRKPPAYSFDSSPASQGVPSQPQSRSPIVYSGGPSPTVAKPRAISPNPNPNHTIRRKSIESTTTPPSEERRLSGVPFGPDSYNELNPTVVASAVKDPATTRHDYDEAIGKIITHDGREIDPSDHLPMESWAPEPEPKQPKAPTLPTRPSPGGSEPYTPGSGRRPLRIAGRPQSMFPAASPQQYALPDPSDPSTPSPLSGANRNRLQRKPSTVRPCCP